MIQGDKISVKERVSKKGSALHKALTNKANIKYAKQGNKDAHKRAKREGMDLGRP